MLFFCLYYIFVNISNIFNCYMYDKIRKNYDVINYFRADNIIVIYLANISIYCMLFINKNKNKNIYF